tara:strand:+ start:603 stop:2051 length:1449 start_codon:yes stop_codon:yes gene_type:complete
MSNFFKHIIIGSGAAGSMIATELIKKDSSVAIIEEGRSFNSDYFKAKKIATRNKNLWRNGGITAFFGKSIIPYAEGVAVGGTTVSNGGVIERPSIEWIENLKSKFKIDGFEYENLKNIFLEVEQKLNVRDHYKENENQNLDSKIWSNYLDKMKISYRKSNLAHTNCKRSNQCISGCPNDAKQTNVLLNYLPEAKKGGTKIFHKNKVIRIKKVGKHWDIYTINQNKKLIFKCEFLYMAAGAIQTPTLLKKNGLSKTAGQRLGFHLNYQIISKFKDVLNSKNGTIFTTDINHYKNLGISFNPANFQKSYMFSKFSNLNNEQVNLIEKNISNYGMYITQLKVDGFASIKANLFGQPIITYELLNSDLVRIKQSIKIICDILIGSGAEEIILPYDNFKVLRSKKEINNLIDNFNLSKMNFVCAHMMSSCAMGNTGNEVVDGTGSLPGENRLMVVDASVIPECTGESPQLTIMSVAKRIIEIKMWNK